MNLATMEVLIANDVKHDEISQDLLSLGFKNHTLNIQELCNVVSDNKEKQYLLVLSEQSALTFCKEVNNPVGISAIIEIFTQDKSAKTLPASKVKVIPLIAPYQQNVLLDVLSQALGAANIPLSLSFEKLPINCTFKSLLEGQITLRNIIKGLNLPDRVYVGLFELVINAIEHGNLEIDYETKSQLIEKKRWLYEVQLRAQREPYKSRSVELTVEQNDQYYIFTITDQGNGFNWLSYSNPITPGDTEKHGRGIIIAQMISFDRVEYQGNGNKVTCYLSKK